MAKPRGEERIPWSHHDAALWYTCEIVYDVLRGAAPTPVGGEIQAPFPPQPPDERFLASGSFTLLDWRALGDGTYMRKTTVVGGTGALGIFALGATLLGSAVGNSARRSQASAAAQPRWVTIASGELLVAEHEFVMVSPQGLWRWRGNAVESADMTGPGHMRMHGTSVNGPVTWVLQSDWAELVFLLWALRHHPRHPRLLDGGWLPHGWMQHAQRHSYDTRLSSPQITIA